MSGTARDFDLIVFGATGVTGREVARYLTEVGANWAAAGRDPAKLERTLAAVDAEPAACMAADVGDPGSLAEMASRGAVVLNLVGPYTSRGRPVIAACVEAGTHYADLTGEIPFVRETIAEFDARGDRGRGQGGPGVRVRGAAPRPRGAAGGRGREGAPRLGAGHRRRLDRGHRPAVRDAAALGHDLRRHPPEHGRGGRLDRPERAHGSRGADRRPGRRPGGPRAQPDRPAPAARAPTGR